jgi:UDP-3-O-[3-hydroxymyristoyl] glucosamine N-acyltransferase
MEIPLKRLAEHVGGHVKGDGDKIIRGVAPFETAADADISFADGPKFIKRLHQCGAGAVIVPEEIDDDTSNLLQVANPKAAFARIVALFNPPVVSFKGISPRKPRSVKDSALAKTSPSPRWYPSGTTFASATGSSFTPVWFSAMK